MLHPGQTSANTLNVLVHQDSATRGRQRSGNGSLPKTADQIWLMHPGKEKFGGTTAQ